MKPLRSFIAVGMVYLLSIGFLPDFRAAACDGHPTDESYVLSKGDCGDTSWELVARYGGGVWDEGEYDATGVCTGGYKKCDCTLVPSGYKTPSKTFSIYYIGYVDYTQTYQWWWDVTNWDGRDLLPCSSGTCQSTGYSGETDYSSDDVEGYDEEGWQPCGD